MIDARPRTLREAIAAGPLVLDAAMGTRLIAAGLDIRHDDPSLWNLTNGEAVAQIHSLDIAAGADALLTNTFGANRAWLSRFGREGDVVAVNRHAAALAREAAGPERFVLGSVGATAADDPEALREQIEALLDAGVDGLLFETFLIEQAVRALTDSADLIPSTVPTLVSLLAWDAPMAEAADRLETLGAAVLGVNCVGLEESLATVRALSGSTWLPLLVKPSAGRPGEPRVSPEAFAAAVTAWLASGVRLIGGCCGSTERHVAAVRAACYDAVSKTGRVAYREGPAT